MYSNSWINSLRGEIHSPQQRKAATALFFLGLASSTQISLIGRLGISELFMAVVAPFIFFKDVELYRRDESMTFFVLLFLWLCGAIFSDLYNNSPFPAMARGVSTPLITLTNCIVLYHFLRKYILNFKWFLVGLALSGVVSIFIFQQGYAGEMAEAGNISGAIDRVVGYKLFWSQQFHTWFGLPMSCFYLSMPYFISCGTVLGLAAYDLLSGGRSSCMMMMISFMLILIGGRTWKSQRKVKRLFFLLMLVLFGVLFLFKLVYKYAATNGWMGAAEQMKYEMQTREGSGFLSLLMAGRMEFFLSLMAAKDRPIVGWGSYTLDWNNYTEEFVLKYGSAEDQRQMMMRNSRQGNVLGFLPHHSHLATYFAWHGMFAFLFWGYTIYLCYCTLRKRMAVMPELYGYFALALPSYMWHVLFSPYGARPEKCFMFCVMLLLAKIGKDQKKLRAI